MIVRGMTPRYLIDQINFACGVHLYTTRENMSMYISKPARMCMNSLYFEGFKAFNELPTYIKECSTPHRFKKELLEFINFVLVNCAFCGLKLFSFKMY
ncbi:unnamed protein product [Acanthoscelides obtectus]|uniref:Uncharacterized protein n=1 Tax=Acanthoscelides obtectus TaxID=200917 RepID=A0A9P0PH67_ACAOB|nr:unnamed protein product [Acanthoscelides obtectus]CAK1623440.1 hypothetical protein AOBTE_LOCUS2005 [Acanthoscelides obtectus]